MGPRDDVLDILKECEGHMRVVSIPTAFIELTGDVSSAGLLSQLLYWTGRTTNAEGWVYKSHAEWKQELGMGRYVVDRARSRLRGLGLLRETCRMANGRRTMHFRVDLAALRSAILLRTGRQESRAPESRIAADRCAENQQTGLSVSSTPTTETTTETTAQTTPETTAESSCESARAEKKERRGAPEGDAGASDGVEEHSAKPQPVNQPAREYFEVVCERRTRRDSRVAAQTVADDVLFDLLERVRGFPRERDQSRLKETLADYPSLDHVREFERFAAYWRGSTLAHPWIALRKWLERAQRREPPPQAVEAARPFTWKRDAIGRCYVVRSDRAAPTATRR